MGNWITGALTPIFNAGRKIGQSIGSSASSIGYGVTEADRVYNSAEAEKQRAWVEKMSNTAVQRQVADINAAGLNPWLAVQSGAPGAAIASGASAASNGASSALAFASSMSNMYMNSMMKIFTSAMSLFGKFGSAAIGAVK